MSIKEKKTHMYEDAKTWNPFRGCKFDCIYCGPTFKRQAKRQKHLCDLCSSFKPHTHEERLDKLPREPIIFVCGVGDLAFCEKPYLNKIIDSVVKHDMKHNNHKYYFQSKRPNCFEPFLKSFSENCILVTTLETNRDDDYGKISKAPVPTVRYKQFKDLDYSRKIITIEPVMDFDHDIFLKMILDVNPELVYIGYNSKPKNVNLPEPSKEKLAEFIDALKMNNIQVKEKDLRGISSNC